MFSPFLMWLLTDLFHDLPEVGDADKSRLVFFLDEAHLLFDDASEAFLESTTQSVRLIRSKGVGVFFVAQTPKDVPADVVLAQLGNRVRHASRPGLRAPGSLMGPVGKKALDRSRRTSGRWMAAGPTAGRRGPTRCATPRRNGVRRRGRPWWSG